RGCRLDFRRRRSQAGRGLLDHRFGRRGRFFAAGRSRVSEPGQPQPGGRQIAQLALPALGVLAAIETPCWFLVGQLPLARIVFALDGVLLGAGDAAFMRTATVVSALAGFLPPIWLSLVFDWGLAGIWSGLTMFIVLRLIFVGWRVVSGRWAVAGK